MLCHYYKSVFFIHINQQLKLEIVMQLRSLFTLGLLLLSAPLFAYKQLQQFEHLDLSPTDHVVFWDLDHTLMEPLRYEGSDPWFRELMAHANDEEKDAVLSIYHAVQYKTQVRPTDPALPTLWRHWSKQAIPMLGLTARSSTLAETTHNQLKSIDLDFHYIGNLNIAVSELNIDRHIIFMSGASKGTALKAIFEAYPELRKKKIIFVDDSHHNVQAVEAALQDIGVDFEVYHYPHSADRYHQTSHVQPF